jgi:microcystin-dependent protein
MSDPFIAEIRILPFNFAPRGWAFCNGQLIPLAQNTALFSLLGTTYGGNGRSTFGLPDLQGRAPMQPGQGPGLALHDLGESAGNSSVTLLTTEMPTHTHALRAAAGSAASHLPGPTRALASGVTQQAYQTNTTGLQALAPEALAAAGGNTPHNNMMPYLVLNFCIALQGVYPPRG